MEEAQEVRRGREGAATRGKGRDGGRDAERRRVRGVVVGREGRGNEEAVVDGGEAEAERMLWRGREERHTWQGGVEAGKGSRCSKVETARGREKRRDAKPCGRLRCKEGMRDSGGRYGEETQKREGDTEAGRRHRSGKWRQHRGAVTSPQGQRATGVREAGGERRVRGESRGGAGRRGCTRRAAWGEGWRVRRGRPWCEAKGRRVRVDSAVVTWHETATATTAATSKAARGDCAVATDWRGRDERGNDEAASGWPGSIAAEVSSG
ncbi:hypothetical protein DFH08DRAFT_808404 [Mycena albidolilacea]|uniref:Uncharacterized protein n=1 Tax=Mycena albidolilacea TaxID=1033008 RepID=A0AAD7A3B6_9AGAR|nr:hypothetical protein DFH08DRAFT_808404 [Mycena albidolilacea]